MSDKWTLTSGIGDKQNTATIHIGDCIEQLKLLPDDSVHTCVTSPPYWGLRDYGTSSWDGGDPDCEHQTSRQVPNTKHKGVIGSSTPLPGADNHTCFKCGATRVDSQIGLEGTPEAYVAKLVEVFREVRRVLRDDGTLWLNLGDSYCSTAPATMGDPLRDDGIFGGVSDLRRNADKKFRPETPAGLKPKDLVGIPWRVAFALQQPYYTGKVHDERDRVWLAAMLDAEGSICGTEYETGDRTKTNLYISITNTATPIIEKCERLFPQDVKHVYEKTNDASNRRCFRWDVERIEIKAVFLREVYPYLVAKRKQAILGYTFLEMQRGLPSKKKGYLPEQHEQRSWLMAALSRLNAGEDVDVPSWCIEPPSLHEPGFYLRQDIIWAKSCSGNYTGGTVMPESVTDRCTKAHEYVFLLTKNEHYFYDKHAVSEPASTDAGVTPWADKDYDQSMLGTKQNRGVKGRPKGVAGYTAYGRRNRRSVWVINPKPYSGAHFATFPEALIEPMILAGTSEKGCCPHCRAPWERLTARRESEDTGAAIGGDPARADGGSRERDPTGAGGNQLAVKRIQTDEWRPSCQCVAHDPVPCLVLDPFTGSGTTGAVSLRLGRNFVGCELNPEYVEFASRRIRGDAPIPASALPFSDTEDSVFDLFDGTL